MICSSTQIGHYYVCKCNQLPADAAIDNSGNDSGAASAASAASACLICCIFAFKWQRWFDDQLFFVFIFLYCLEIWRRFNDGGVGGGVVIGQFGSWEVVPEVAPGSVSEQF